MSIVKILAIVVVTSVVTFLCIRSGQAMGKTPKPSPPVGRPEAHDRGKRPHLATSDQIISSAAAPNAIASETTSAPFATATGPDNASSSFGATSGPDMASISLATASGSDTDSSSFGTTSGPETTSSSFGADLQNGQGNRTGNRSGDEDGAVMMPTSRSLNAGTMEGSNTSGFRSRALPIVVRGKLIRPIPNPTANDVDGVDDRDSDNSDGAKIIIDTGVYHVDNGYVYTVMHEYNFLNTVESP